MAGDWIKMRVNLHADPRVFRIADRLEIEPEDVVYHLYRVACWFRTHGDYGAMDAQPDVVSFYLRMPGFAEAMVEECFLVVRGECMMLSSFCDVSSIRKSIGAKLRSQVLKDGVCTVCGFADHLVVDHIKPVYLGGATERENLQALCVRCNRTKGKRTMEEFLNDRRP